MQIGKITRFKSDSEENNLLFTGNFHTMEFSIDYFELIRNPFRSPDTKRPDYLIYGRNAKADKVEIGAGWHREFLREGIKGEMISLTFDDPSFKNPINVTAFKGDDEDSWPITWRRERAKPAV
jgi:uncharacterized protein (DUF736 family)